MSTPKAGEYGWGKTAEGAVVLGPVLENVALPMGWLGLRKKVIPTAVCDGNAGRVVDVNYITEWHPFKGDENPS